MKKIYIIPTTTVVKVETVHMIAASENITLGGSYDGSSVIQSRRGNSFWDDDEDEY